MRLPRLPCPPTLLCAMLISIPTGTFLSYLLLISSARAQVSVPNCTDATLNWTFNSLQQNPCLVAATLAAECNNGYYPGNQCLCNTVSYNLFSACSACQGESWKNSSEWLSNCTPAVIANSGTFPGPIPVGIRVPKWAYFAYGINDSWDVTMAQTVGGARLHHSFCVSIPNWGGVVGGIVGTALIAVVVFWFALRRLRARSVPSLDMGEREQQPPRPLAGAAPRLYDPSDPTTYPIREDFPQLPGPASHTQSSGGGYTGVPEVSG
ncbi:hypothetical protein EI94DRAFT_1730415 [Lactarius quietus]|nr:hypothetical protein EI94DRAFT_1730415 [Lactarius quietus]